MAKIYGLFGAMTGKLADTVMSVRNGEQIARKYQPVVFNPSTPAQVAQRAKIKLLSQLSAVMAPVIAIAREGSVSSRNLFTKVNYRAVGYTDDTASVTLSEIQLTKSVVAFPSIYAARSESAISAYIANANSVGPIDVSRVVYCLFEKQADEKLRFVASKVATEAGSGNTWSVSGFPLISGEGVMLAYGIRDNNENARVVFGNLQAVTAENIAKVVTNRTLTESDITMTETKGVTIAVPNAKETDSEKSKSQK